MSVIKEIEQSFKKPHVIDVKSGDVVRVHQKIREGSKERVQVFEGLVIQTKRKNSLSSSITVRRIASGVGVEKTFLMHSPLVTKIEVVKRNKVRRNYLSYMRERTGKSARLSAVDFDQGKVNYAPEPAAPRNKADASTASEEKASEAQSSTSAEAGSAAKEPKAEVSEDQKNEVQKPDEPNEKTESKQQEPASTDASEKDKSADKSEQG